MYELEERLKEFQKFLARPNEAINEALKVVQNEIAEYEFEREEKIRADVE